MLNSAYLSNEEKSKSQIQFMKRIDTEYLFGISLYLILKCIRLWKTFHTFKRIKIIIKSRVYSLNLTLLHIVTKQYVTENLKLVLRVLNA